MSQIRSKNTKPEIIVRSLLHRMGYRFSLHSNFLPGKPDIILPKYKTVIFVHGCFWHRHPECKYAYTPKSRTEWWLNKFQKNIERDKVVFEQTKELGWEVVVIWECELRDMEGLQCKLASIFEGKISSNSVIGKFDIDYKDIKKVAEKRSAYYRKQANDI